MAHENGPDVPEFQPVGELHVESHRPRPIVRPQVAERSETPRPALDLDLEALRIPLESAPAALAPARGGWLKFLLLLVLLGAGALYLGRERLPASWRALFPGMLEARKPTVKVTRARRVTPREQAVAGAFSAAGWVKLPLYHPVYVTALIEGRVEELLVIEGDAVQKGQVLARLYALDYCAECQAAEAEVEAARAAAAKMKAGYRVQEVEEVRAELDRLHAELETARKILSHSEALHPKGAIPLEELQKDALRVRTLEAEIDKTKHGLALLEEGYREEDVALALATLQKAEAKRDLAKQRLGYVEIKSPIKGVVLERLASRGQWLQPKDGAIVTLYDPTDLEASVDISQDDLGKVFLGQEVEIITRAEPGRRYVGEVVLIEPKADLVKNTVPVRVKVRAEKDGLLFPDMVVKARFLPRPEEKTTSDETAAPEVAEPRVTIPLASVLRVGGQAFVVLVDGGKARRVRVELGEPSNGRVEVKQGLEGGETVIVSDPGAVPEGQEVQIRADE